MSSNETFSFQKKYPVNIVYLVATIFALIFFSISIPNHIFYRTAALDLGLYTNALFDYSHFQFNDSTLCQTFSQNLLADHFDLMMMILSPLAWIFGLYTLLIVQVCFVIVGGIGVYQLLKARQLEQWMCLAGMLLFYLNFSIYSALAFDYHSIVVAASLIPWLFYFIEKKNRLLISIIAVLIIICQESVALGMIFILLGASFIYRRQNISKFLLLLSVFTAAYLIIITTVVMPSLATNKKFNHFDFNVLGDDYLTAIRTLITKPLTIFKLLFINNSNDPSKDYLKAECWIFFLMSGGALLLFRPAWLFMLIPVFILKFLNDITIRWGANAHYHVEFAPIIAIGAISVIQRIKNVKLKKLVTAITILASLVTTFQLTQHTYAFVPRSPIAFYEGSHWRSIFNNTNSLDQAFALIPENSAVASNSNFTPHLALRNKCYALPLVKDAEYILYSIDANPYPITKEMFKVFSDSLENDSLVWKKIFSADGYVVLRRIK